jgi:hypothetical protein
MESNENNTHTEILRLKALRERAEKNYASLKAVFGAENFQTNENFSPTTKGIIKGDFTVHEAKHKAKEALEEIKLLRKKLESERKSIFSFNKNTKIKKIEEAIFDKQEQLKQINMAISYKELPQEIAVLKVKLQNLGVSETSQDTLQGNKKAEMLKEDKLIDFSELESIYIDIIKDDKISSKGNADKKKINYTDSAKHQPKLHSQPESAETTPEKKGLGAGMSANDFLKTVPALAKNTPEVYDKSLQKRQNKKVAKAVRSLGEKIRTQASKANEKGSKILTNLPFKRKKDTLQK